MRKWHDPKLGEFTFSDGGESAFSGIGWEKEIKLDAFSVFSYDSQDPSRISNNQSVLLTIEVDDEDELPTEEVINVVYRTLENHEKLLSRGIDDLFNDMLGKEPDTWMWWNDGLDDIREHQLKSEVTPEKPYVLNKSKDLYKIMGNPGITFQKYSDKYDKPCSTIGFEAVFDKGNGIGFLTNGINLLGLGYRIDPPPYE